MSTPVFAVVLDEPNDQARERLQTAYPNIYLLNDTVSLVRTDGLAESVAITAGIKGDDRIVSGIVFKLNRAYSGYRARSVWEWLQQGEESG